MIVLKSISVMARVSIFVGTIKALPESGRPTGIYKLPVSDSIALGFEGFEGDQQADRKVHGGPEKAVHLYPASHYAKLADRFPDVASDLVAGSLGENLSTNDLDESDVRIGDIWQLGTAKIQVCQPRNPCWKIDDKFSCEGMAVHIAEHRLTGWYWRVIEPGHVNAGDPLILVQAAIDTLTLSEAMLLWQEHRPDLLALQRFADMTGIASGWKNKINQRLSYLKTDIQK